MKTKKLLSIILAVLMLTASFSSALTVFAAEDNVTEVKNIITAFSGDMTKADASAEDLAAYNEMVSAFNALSSEEREAFDVILFDKLLLAVYDREVALLKAGGMSNSNALKKAHTQAKTVISMPAYVETAAALYNEAYNIKTQAQFDAFVESLKAAPANAAVLAGGYYRSYGTFRYSVYNDKYGAELIFYAADKLSSVTEKADSANKPVSPKSVSKPSMSESDPAYAEAYQKYLAYKEAQAQYYEDLYAFEFEKHYLPHVKVLTEACPYFTFVYDICKNTIEAKRNFNENGDTAKINEVMAVYNTLSDSQKGWFAAVDGTYMFAEKVENKVSDYGVEYTYKRYKTVELIDFCVSMEFYYTVKNFSDTVASIELPCNNADIEKAKAAYNEIPASLITSIPAEAAAKYEEILACAGPDTAVDNEPELDAYIETDIPYDISGNKAESLVNSIFDIVLDVTKTESFRTVIDTNILTNKTVVSLAGMIYELLEEKTNGLLNITPADMKDYLTEEKFAGALDAFNAAGESWDAVEIENGALGFEDGDEEGFLDAAAAMLRGVALIQQFMSFENKLNPSEGTYTYGAYEELIPVFEILDLRSVMSSADYTDYVNAAENKSDARFRAILAPVVYLIADIGNDPVNTLLDVLPKLSYAIDSGIVNTQINKILSMLPDIISLDPVDLTTAGIYSILNDKLLAPKGITLSEEEFTALIEALSGCGTAVKKESVMRGVKYRMGIDSDSGRVSAVLLLWVLDIAGKNQELVNTLLGALVGENGFVGAILKIAIILSTTVIPRAVVFNLLSIFITIARVFLSVVSIF